MAFFLALACTSEPPPGPPTLPLDLPDEVTALEGAGFVVGEGRFGFSDMSGCCEADAQCWGNNPYTPYGTVTVPLGYTQDSEDAIDILGYWGPIDEGQYRTFHLRPDEAIVTFGTLPPAARYFSYRSYLGLRVDEPPILGSLGASMNHLTLAAERGGPIWGEPAAFVTSLDQGTEDRVREALRAAGWAPEQIHADRITGEVVRPGFSAEADTFFIASRLALFDDPAAGAAFMAAPTLRVLRVTPETEAPWTEPWPRPELPARGSGEAESAELAQARNALVVAVMAEYVDRSPVPTEAVPYWAETLDCIANSHCGGDIRDRYTSNSPEFWLAPGEAMISIGVNHERSGRASYSSATVQSIDEGRGIVSFASHEMVGSARQWLPDHPRADDLYVWTVARDCTGWPEPCTELPAACPGLPFGDRANVLFRAYLEPATGAAPLPEELVPDVAIKIPRAL